MASCLFPTCSIKCVGVAARYQGMLFLSEISEGVSVHKGIPRKIVKYTFSELDDLRTHLESNSAMF